MTDLSTVNLKHLLAEATPGPDDDDKLALATLSTALAEEVLRLRKELTNLQVEARYAELFHATGLTAKQVFEALDTTISETLGDHDA